MELWIRSQDKEVLLNIKGIQYQNYKLVENETVEANILIGFYNYYDNEILGEYETKERAIEILDEIQSLLQPTIEYKPIVQEEYNPAYEYKHFVKVDDNMEIKELSTFVYQMPEK